MISIEHTERDAIMPDENPADTFHRLQGLGSTVRQNMAMAARVTTPEVCPPEGVSPDDLDREAIGTSLPAMMVGNLANIIVSTLTPSEIPFLSVSLTEKGEEEMRMVLGDQDASPEEVETRMLEIQAIAEMGLLKQWVQWQQSSNIAKLVRHAIVNGQGIALIDDNTEEITPILPTNYAITRTSSAHIKALCVRSFTQVFMLPDEVVEYLEAEGHDVTDTVEVIQRWQIDDRAPGKGTAEADAFTYSYAIAVDGMHLDFMDKERIKRFDTPIVDMPWEIPAGANYGIGPVFDNLPALRALSMMSHSILVGVDEACNTKWFVSRGAGITPEEFAEMQGGDARWGERDGIQPMHAENYQAIAQAIGVRDQYRAELSSVFLYQPGMVRDSERTTATEIRMMMEALHAAGHSSAYAMMAKHAMPTIARVLMERAKIKQDDTIDVIVSAGSSALSRRAEAARFSEFVQTLSGANALPPQVQMATNWNSLSRLAASWFSIDSTRIMTNQPQQPPMPTEGGEQPEVAANGQ